MYRSASSNGQWLVMSLISQAQREGEKAKRLAHSPQTVATIRRNSIFSNSRRAPSRKHARAYLKLLDIVFPEAVDPAFRSELNQFSPNYSMSKELSSPNGGGQPSLSDYLNLNIDEAHGGAAGVSVASHAAIARLTMWRRRRQH